MDKNYIIDLSKYIFSNIIHAEEIEIICNFWLIKHFKTSKVLIFYSSRQNIFAVEIQSSVSHYLWLLIRNISQKLLKFCIICFNETLRQQYAYFKPL